MALPGGFAKPKAVQRYGVVLLLVPDPGQTQWELADVELEQADDDGGGAPDVGTVSTIMRLGPLRRAGEVVSVDLPNDSVRRHWRWRHVRTGFDPGSYTDWLETNGVQGAKPSALPLGASRPVIRLSPYTDDGLPSSTAATIGTLTASEPSAGTVRWTASDMTGNVRAIRWYIRRNAASGVYPTDTGAAGGVLNETYQIGGADRPIAADLGGYPYAEQTGYGGGDDSSVIAVPVDYNGNPGTRASATYAYAGSVTRAPSAPAWVVNTSGSISVQRTYDFSWGAGTMLAADDLRIVASIDGTSYDLVEETTDPTSTTTKTNIALDNMGGPQLFPDTGYPMHGISFLWELRSAGILINSGTVSPPSGETVKGVLVL